VPGKLSDPENVIVDVGTGYYVKKVRPVLIPSTHGLPIGPVQTRAEAIKHYEGKIDYIRTNLETLQDTIQKKQDNMSVVTNIMQAKLQAQASEKGNKD
jgi:prefoldin alpha subunit